MSGKKGRSGRPRTPTALKRLRGNPGNRPLPKDEPMPATPRAKPGDEFMPADMSKAARKHWPRVRDMLLKAKILSVADESALLNYCESNAIYWDAMSHVDLEGSVVPGMYGPKVNPYFNVGMKAHDKMHAFWIEYGMTPASRARTKVTEYDPHKGAAQPQERPAAGDKNVIDAGNRFAGIRKRKQTGGRKTRAETFTDEED